MSGDTHERCLETGQMERTTGIEPALSAWEADVMPFHYVRELDESQVLSIPNRR